MSDRLYSVRLTERGWRFLAGLLVIWFLALIFVDVLIGALGLGISGFLIYSWFRLRVSVREMGDLVSLSPVNLEASMTAGQVYDVEIKVNSSYRGVLALRSGISEVSLEPGEVYQGKNSLACTFRPSLSGEYFSDHLIVSLTDAFGLFKCDGRIPFTQSYRVYPRVLEAAVEAVEYLMESDVFGSGAQLTRLRGGGSEYADTRPYVVGDSMRQFDWKASARLDRLMVKEYYLEGGIQACVLFEAEASDAASKDELSAAFLRVVTMYARMDAPLDLMIYDKSGVLLNIEQIQPSLAVGQAMKYAIDVAEVKPDVLFDILDPRSSSFLREFLSELAAMGGIQRSEGVNPVVGVFMGRDVEHLRITAVSSILDPVPLIELARLAGANGWVLEVLQPTRPWVNAGHLGDAVERWRYYDRMYGILEKNGVVVAASLEEIREQVIEDDRLNLFR